MSYFRGIPKGSSEAFLGSSEIWFLDVEGIGEGA